MFWSSVLVREREREREFVCVCVCVWERVWVCMCATVRVSVCMWVHVCESVQDKEYISSESVWSACIPLPVCLILSHRINYSSACIIADAIIILLHFQFSGYIYLHIRLAPKIFTPLTLNLSPAPIQRRQQEYFELWLFLLLINSPPHVSLSLLSCVNYLMTDTKDSMKTSA